MQINCQVVIQMVHTGEGKLGGNYLWLHNFQIPSPQIVYCTQALPALIKTRGLDLPAQWFGCRM